MRDPLGYNHVGPDDYITITPMDRAECVIRAKYVNELNEQWEDKPAMVFIVDPDLPPNMRKDHKVAMPITADEYARLKLLLTGDAPAPTKADYEMAIATIPPEPAAKNPVAKKPTAKKPVAKKGGAKKK